MIAAAFRRRPFGAAMVSLLPWLAASSGLPAQAQEAPPAPLNLILILDASGSMWAPVPLQDASRFAAAVRVLTEVGDQLPDTIEVGVIAYGHRRQGDCGDIETIVPLGIRDRASTRRIVDAIKPKGKTPLARAARQAFDELGVRGHAGIVVLLTDGLDTCDGDLVAEVRAAKEQGLDFALDIVGFYVADEDTRELEDAALAGCGRYFSTGNTSELAIALKSAIDRLGAVSTVRDEFDTAPFGGDSGKGGWRFGWEETGEGDGPGDGGEIEIEIDRTCFEGACLNVEADAGSEGVIVERQVNLDGVDLAVLSFTYGHDGDAGSEIVLEVSGDSGLTWTLLDTFRLNGDLFGQRASYDLMPWATRDTRFRFRVTVAEWGDLGIDDLHLDWGVAAGGGLPAESATVVDEFTFYGGNDGSRTWSGSWVENDDDHAGRGAVRLTSSERCRADQCLKIKPASGGAGAGIRRQADLSGAISATLTYHFEHNLFGGDAVVVEVSGDGGGTYTVLETYSEYSARAGDESFDISAFIAADTWVRFRTTDSGRGKGLWIDDLQIEYADPGICTGPASERSGS